MWAQLKGDADFSLVDLEVGCSFFLKMAVEALIVLHLKNLFSDSRLYCLNVDLMFRRDTASDKTS